PEMVLLPLHDVLAGKLADEGLRTAAEIEFRALPAVVWMEAGGVPFDVAAWSALRDEAAEEARKLEEEIAAQLPGVNPGAGPQVRAALAAVGIRVADVQEATLRAVADRHPAVGLLLRRREAKKRATTYGDGYLQHVHAETGRIHADFRQIGAASGRMACSA